MPKRRTGLLARTPHTRALARTKQKKPRGLNALIAEARGLIEKHAFLVRRSEYLLQQSVMLRAMAEEIDSERRPLSGVVQAMSDRLEKVLDANKQATPPAKRKGRARG